MKRARMIAALSLAIAIPAGYTAWVIACGPFTTTLNPRQSVVPVNPEAYRRGELGLVRPTFDTYYLVDAYRVLLGLPAESARRSASPVTLPIDEWREVQTRVAAAFTPPLSVAPRVDPDRRMADYSSFPNCLDDAFVAALRTLRARIARYGATSREVADWIGAQTTVFRNCGEGELALPAPAPAWADADLVADREYQSAAAYFYATRYDEAVTRFRAIAQNARSQWRSMGRYLAARALIRAATVEASADRPALRRERFEAAQNELRAVVADPSAAIVHASARGLLDYIAGQLRPVERLRELSGRLATAGSPTGQDVDDFVWLLRRSDAGGEGGDLSDWIRGMRGDGEQAITRWRDTRSVPWLVAALWTAPAQHDAVLSLLGAAADVPRTSPIYATIAFLRVRLLIRRGDRAEARSLLATLPAKPDAAMNREMLNLIRAERFALAESLDELLDNAPRTIVSKSNDIQDLIAVDPGTDTSPIFDEDAGVTFTHRLPLDRLVQAAESTRLPSRLRRRVAEAAFARAVVLRRPAAGLRLAQVLRDLAPVLRADLDRYRTAKTEDARHRAGILLLLRTPGLHAYVVGIEGEPFMNANLSPRRFNHVYKDNWWCAPPEPSATIVELYDTQPIPSPSFISSAERMAVNDEMHALRAAGPAPAYLTAEALAWARALPGDVNAAEALAQAIEGWRWSYCGSGDTPSDLPRQAFQTLHRLFPKSQAAARTKYWYR